MNILFETLIKDFVTSGITDKSIDKSGLGSARFIKAVLNMGKSLHLLFEVDSSSDQGSTHFSVNGQPLHGLNKGYAVQVKFNNINKVMPADFTSLPYSQQAQIIQQVFDQCDAQVQCDCGAFYWQGMFEKDDEKNNTSSPFTGTAGKDIWANRHDQSGNKRGEQLCKHLYSVVNDLNNEVPNIVKNLSGTIAQMPDESTLPITTPTTAPPTPEDIPDENTELEDEIETNIPIDTEEKEEEGEIKPEEVMTSSDQGGNKTLNTTNVPAEKREGENTAAKGPNEYEPPIEEPHVSESVDEDEMKNLENPIENIQENLFEKIYRRSHLK